jgi:hypothetical protein
MPLGLVDDDDFEKELGNCGITAVVQDKKSPGRSKGDNNVPEGLRKIIGETSEIEGRKEALELAAKFDISPSSVSAYANGATSTTSYDEPNSDLLEHINSQKSKVAKRARNKLLSALSRITPEKLDSVGVVALAGVAKAMSGIVKDMEPSTSVGPNGQTGPTFVFYAPRVISEDKLPVIDLNE